MNQFIQSDELWWDSEISCATCGLAGCENAGPGRPPEDVRNALLAAHGAARLRVAGPMPSLLSALKVLREVFGASLREAREQADELRREGLVGTRAEMEFLAVRLRRRGVPVGVEACTN
ncbi:hypothetical protein ABH930_006220 [Kitasatospora sp. GAS204A]|uniref:hypothetical protein n=1 Tax=unclassified Kitasatospora TaxID=2633591 RepID=UPI00247562B3|nr:hypothetical protein [Kitasatospora sp. GAS204B]MDH6120258.1 hypothetical protein [Kitasatospora sp. GAS204B]